jgi:hypothetical protein
MPLDIPVALGSKVKFLTFPEGERSVFFSGGRLAHFGACTGGNVRPLFRAFAGAPKIAGTPKLGVFGTACVIVPECSPARRRFVIADSSTRRVKALLFGRPLFSRPGVVAARACFRASLGQMQLRRSHISRHHERTIALIMQLQKFLCIISANRFFFPPK